jgi:membrane protease YdiL (CAAX protease family)
MPLGVCILGVIWHALGFLLVLMISGTWSLSRFVRDFQLHKPSFRGALTYGFIGAGIALSWVIVADQYFGQPPPIQTSFPVMHGGTGVELGWIILLVLYAAFIEEVLFRGYMYRAFRIGWGIFTSTVCVMLITLLFHWNVVTRSNASLVLHSMLAVFLCVVREKSDGLWNCIICHCSYNLALCAYGGWNR